MTLKLLKWHWNGIHTLNLTFEFSPKSYLTLNFLGKKNHTIDLSQKIKSFEMVDIVQILPDILCSNYELLVSWAAMQKEI